MLLSLFKPSPVIDDSTRLWIFDTYSWAIETFDHDFFKESSDLILPNNTFYPGKVNSVEGMAQRIFDQTLAFVGLQHWPIRLVSPHQYQTKPMPKLVLPSRLRVSTVNFTSYNLDNKNDLTPKNLIEVSYNPNQVNQPQDLISYFVQVLSSILVHQVGSLPPGGKDFLPQSIDLVASFFGFGVMFSNTAYQFKGGCGSCNNPSLNREVALPELESTYSLALFCQIKSIEDNKVLPHLKPHLKKLYKRSKKDILEHVSKSKSLTKLLN